MLDGLSQVPQTGRALQIVEEGRRKQDLVKWIRENLPQGGAELGVSNEYLAGMAYDLALTTDELRTIADIRTHHQAKIPAIKALIIKEDLTPDEVQGIYAARDSALTQLNDGTESISLKQLARFIKTFRSAIPDEDLGEQIADLHQEVRAIRPWITYPDSSLKLLCDIATYYDLADVQTAIEALENKPTVVE